MNGKEIRNELEDLLDAIDLQIEEVRRDADEAGFAPTQMKNADGTHTMVPLLVAKAQVLSTLGTLRPTIVNVSNPPGPGRKW